MVTTYGFMVKYWPQIFENPIFPCRLGENRIAKIET
eukprot:SAG11_NODE_27903_length_327_cov_1.122807_1_plen_35_part_10